MNPAPTLIPPSRLASEVEAVEVQLASVADDDPRLREADARQWRVRALVFVSVVMIGSPLAALICWTLLHWSLVRDGAAALPLPPGPAEPALVRAYSRYMRTEGPGHRGLRFSYCALLLSPMAMGPGRAITEQELRF